MGKGGYGEQRGGRGGFRGGKLARQQCLSVSISD